LPYEEDSIVNAIFVPIEQLAVTDTLVLELTTRYQ